MQMVYDSYVGALCYMCNNPQACTSQAALMPVIVYSSAVCTIMLSANTNHPDCHQLRLLHLLLLIACSTVPLLIVKQVFSKTVAFPDVLACLCPRGPMDAEL